MEKERGRRPLFELEDFPVDPAEKPEGWREREEQMRAAPPLQGAVRRQTRSHSLAQET